MMASVERATGNGRVKPGASPVLMAVVAALVLTLILALLFVKGRRTTPAGTPRQEQRSSVGGPVSAVKAQKPSPLRLMEARPAKAARGRMRIRSASGAARPDAASSSGAAETAPVSSASYGRMAAGAQ